MSAETPLPPCLAPAAAAAEPETAGVPWDERHLQCVWADDRLRPAALATTGGLPVRVLDEPMRWSEDFGWYLKRVPGQFFGIGIGEDHPGLHTGDYVFDDRAIAPALSALLALL